MKRTIYFFIFLSAVLMNCSNPGEDRIVDTWQPEYFKEFKDVKVLYRQKINNLIIENNYKSFQLALEPYEGIHLLVPPMTAFDSIFWEIPGLTAYNITDSILTFRMKRDVIRLNIADVHKIKLIDIQNAYTLDINSMSPYGKYGSFECVDTSKGYVRRWSLVEIFDPKCWK